MSEYELDKRDFDLINKAFNALLGTADPLGLINRAHADFLQNRFAKAYTGWLELEDD